MVALATLPRMAEPYVVPGTYTWLEADLRVVLAAPQGAEGPVPLLFLLDGQAMLLTAAEYSRTTSLVTMGTLPPIAVVGVWRETDPFDYMTTRFRDFTPYEWTLPEPFAEDNTMARYGTGGAAAYLDLLVDRVLPAVRASVDISEVAVGGWSLSGLFAPGHGVSGPTCSPTWSPSALRCGGTTAASFPSR